jgi:hypothetical protein
MSVLARRVRAWKLPDLENNWRLIVALPIVFFGLFWIGNRIQLLVCEQYWFDCPIYWPISIFILREPPLYHLQQVHIAAALFAALTLFLATFFLKKAKYRLWPVLIFGIVLIFSSTLTHGIRVGLRQPIEGTVQDKREYYNQAETIDSPLEFLQDFNELQVDLLTHSHTHPPFATLLFYYLGEALGSTLLIAVFITVVAATVGGIYFYRLLRREFNKEYAGYMVFILLLTPAVQLYFAVTLDALILALSLAAVVGFVNFDSKWSLIWASIFTILTSFLTFAFLFLPVAYLGYELWTRRSVRRTVTIVITLIVTYALMFLIFGYDYVESFLLAALLENVSEDAVGWRLLWDTVNYFFTRIENVAEYIFFLGPYEAGPGCGRGNWIDVAYWSLPNRRNS